MNTIEAIVCESCGRAYGCSNSAAPCPWCECERLRAENESLRRQSPNGPRQFKERSDFEKDTM